MKLLLLLAVLAQDETVFESEGVRYRVAKGGEAYQWKDGRWEFIKRIYDPDFFAKNYVEKDGRTWRKDDGGRLVEVGRSFRADFEGADSIRDLIGEKRGFTEFTLQSPKAKTVADYVKLRHRILRGEGDFVDNRVEPETKVVHGGSRALRTVCVPATADMVCGKASIGTELIHFKKGDDVWFSGWYHVVEGMPFTVMDLESTWIEGSAGIRVCISDDARAYVELKWADKPKYRPSGPRVEFPRGRWVRLRVHFKLSEKEDGVVELWQDDAKVVDAKGRTLPLAGAIYNNLEIGISANGKSHATTLLVDDVSISDRE